MSYGIFRCEKVKTPAIKGVEQEHKRESEIKPWQHIQQELSPNNQVWLGCDDFKEKALDICKEKGIKPKANAILILDNVYTYSSEWTKMYNVRAHLNHSQFSNYFGYRNGIALKEEDCTETQLEHRKWLKEYNQLSPEEQKRRATEEYNKALDYFKKCLKWQEKTLGVTIYAELHVDEDNLHMHSCSVPIIEEPGKKARLSARDVVGNKHKMSQMQSKFIDDIKQEYEREGKEFTLKRGKKKAISEEHISAAQHELEEIEIQATKKQNQVDILNNRIKELLETQQEKELIIEGLSQNQDDIMLKISEFNDDLKDINLDISIKKNELNNIKAELKEKKKLEEMFQDMSSKITILQRNLQELEEKTRESENKYRWYQQTIDSQKDTINTTQTRARDILAKAKEEAKAIIEEAQQTKSYAMMSIKDMSRNVLEEMERLEPSALYEEFHLQASETMRQAQQRDQERSQKAFRDASKGLGTQNIEGPVL